MLEAQRHVAQEIPVTHVWRLLDGVDRLAERDGSRSGSRVPALGDADVCARRAGKTAGLPKQLVEGGGDELGTYLVVRIVRPKTTWDPHDGGGPRSQVQSNTVCGIIGRVGAAAIVRKSSMQCDETGGDPDQAPSEGLEGCDVHRDARRWVEMPMTGGRRGGGEAEERV